MRLSWNEVRARAAEFANDWANAKYEKSETQPFYEAFFDVFGIRRRSVARYEEHVKKLDNKDGYIDLFWPQVLLVEQKTAGRNLEVAREQALEYVDALAEWQRPRYLLLCDFQTWRLIDLDQRTEIQFKLAELPEQVTHFGFMMGVQPRTFREQDPVNIAASELIGAVHDGLRESGYSEEHLDRFLVRLVFCLFADDTGIFEPHSFINLLEERTSEDGADVGLWLDRLFTALNRPEDERPSKIDEDIAAFPYINGDLFKERLETADFDRPLREALIAAANFDWSVISPAIFGALFQSVMNPDARRAVGAHYTTEQNILKVIEPLFLDDLRAEFDRLKQHRGTRRGSELRQFQKRLGRMRFLDPACGCGNFLIVAYRELRRLELDVLLELYPDERQSVQDISALTVLGVEQFYGIEILEFPVQIAQTALWMMDHLMNLQLSDAFGQYFARIPLGDSPHIVCADALETDWNGVLPADECSYVFGNPPFVGSKLQTDEQRNQVQRIAQLGGSGGTLDYVAAWFIRAGEYAQDGDTPIGFVATNSITQGEQVGQLWPVLYDRCDLEIVFAHRPFAWGSEARGKAHVHVVVIGLNGSAQVSRYPSRRLFTENGATGEISQLEIRLISPYLVDGSSLGDHRRAVRRRSAPLNALPEARFGTQPIDGGHYILDDAARRNLLSECPRIAPFVRPFLGGHEFLNGGSRWILHLEYAPSAVLRQCEEVRERIRAVRAFRLASKRKATQELAKIPRRFAWSAMSDHPYILIPATSSEKREYIPIGWVGPNTIASNAAYVVRGAEMWHFGLLTSSMHMAWMRAVAGRLESRYRYSNGVVYNTFPLPDLGEARRGEARRGEARRGEARRGEARRGEARRGIRSSKSWGRPCLMRGPSRRQARRSPISTTPKPCRQTCAWRTATWTDTSTVSTDRPGSSRSVSG